MVDGSRLIRAIGPDGFMEVFPRVYAACRDELKNAIKKALQPPGVPVTQPVPPKVANAPPSGLTKDGIEAVLQPPSVPVTQPVPPKAAVAPPSGLTKDGIEAVLQPPSVLVTQPVPPKAALA